MRYFGVDPNGWPMNVYFERLDHIADVAELECGGSQSPEGMRAKVERDMRRLRRRRGY